MEYQKEIEGYLIREKAVIEHLDIQQINSMMNEFEAVRKREGTIFIFGNGGSAATASHMTNDLNRGVSGRLDQKFRCVCLNDNVPTMLAIANDLGYEEVFRHQLLGKLREEDLVVGISGSGNSANIVNAIRYAKECGVRTMGLVGFDGGKVKQLADVSVHVPVMNMQITEDIHMILDHLMMTVFLERLD